MPGRDIWAPLTVTVSGRPDTKITVVRGTVAHQQARDRYYLALERAADRVDRWYQERFAAAMAQTVAVEGFAFEIPAPTAAAPVIQEAYENFRQLDRTIANTWLNAVEEVDLPPGPKETWPAYRLTDDEKKDSGSNESNGADGSDDSS